MSHEIMDRVSAKLAGSCVKRGVRSYSYEDMYQDAYLACLQSVSKYKEDKGCLEGYLYTCASNKLKCSITRALSPVSSANNNNMEKLGAMKKLMSIYKLPDNCGDASGDDFSYLDQAILSKQIYSKFAKFGAKYNISMRLVHTKDEGLDGKELALRMLLQAEKPASKTQDKKERSVMYAHLKDVKNKIKADNMMIMLYHALNG